MFFVKKIRPRDIIPFPVQGIESHHAFLRSREEYASRVLHLQRVKQQFLQGMVHGLVTNLFDDTGGQFAGKSIDPVRAGFTGQGRCRYGGKLLLQGIVSPCPEGPHALLHALECDILGGGIGIAVGKPAFHGESVPDGDGGSGGNHFHIAVGMAQIFFAFLPLREIVAHRVREQEFPLLIEQHHGGVEGDLGHGCLTEQTVLCDGDAAGQVGVAEVAFIKAVSPLHDFQRAARQPSLHKTFQEQIYIFRSCHSVPPMKTPRIPESTRAALPVSRRCPLGAGEYWGDSSGNLSLYYSNMWNIHASRLNYNELANGINGTKSVLYKIAKKHFRDFHIMSIDKTL
ncbi:hypothetical protein IMSAGC003_01220 [Lachnospiraceae bacterium]|nr:hypothetical protein IMSAGC003_01220 [Lachnospiraceae bacterium]